MRVVEIIFILGSQCVSPMENIAATTTMVHQVPCAVIRRHITEETVVPMTNPPAIVLPAVTKKASGKPYKAKKRGACGSKKQVWYKNKYGKKRYRCR